MRYHIADILASRRFSIRHSKSWTIFACLIVLCVCLLPASSAEAKVKASVSKDYDKWKNLTANELNKNANSFLKNNMPDSAMVCYSIVANKLESASTSEERREAASAKMNIGYMYSTYFYDFHNAFDYFTEALKNAEQENYKELMACCYVNLGSLYSTYHQMVDDKAMFDEAVEMYRKAYRTAKEANFTSSMLTAVYNMAVIYLEKKNIDIIRNELNDFLSISSQGKPERWQHVTFFIRGLLAMSDGNYDDAFENLNKSLLYKNENGIQIKDKAVIHLAMAINFMRSGNPHKAKDMCLNILSQARQNGFIDIISSTYRELGNIYKELGEREKANEFHLKYFYFKDSIVESSKIKDVKNLRFLDELNAKNNEVNRLASQKRNQGRILTISIVCLIIAASVLLVIMIYNKRLRKRNLELYDRLQESLREKPDEKNVYLINPKEKGLEETDSLSGIVEEESRYKNNTLSPQDMSEILNRAKTVLSTSKEIYSPDFSLDRLSEILEVNRSYLSRSINETGGSNFKTLLNSYRIREACKRLEDSDNFGGQTIEAIGQSVGFLSRRNFGLAFKKETGLSPSAFVKIYQEKQNERQNEL